MTNASICTIGDEILIGQITDTNSAHIAQELNKEGIKVNKIISISDDRQEIENRLTQELAENQIVVVTGGLGPTKDDVTKNVLFKMSGSTRWVQNEEQLAIIHRILSARGLDALQMNIDQASVPENCNVIPNRKGTAPVMAFHFPPERFGHPAALYSLPGVPHEALGALNDVLEDIRTHFALDEIRHKTIMTFGIAESALAKKLEDWENALPEEMHLAYLPNITKGVTLRLSVYGKGNRSTEETDLMFEEQISSLRQILGSAIYSEKEETLEAALGRILKEKGLTISTAESCTGGMVSALITSVPGSSEYYLGSVVSYANTIKENVLGVPSGIIEKYGAVSSECVARMAEGVRHLMGTDYSVATSGISGPGGGTEEKPVGLVWVGVSSEKGTITRSFHFRSDRKRNTDRFAASALDTVRLFILNELNN